ncbi:MAG: hypothetical protein J5640_02900 [Bacteroidales bacterium]|nr:hypothetical protein [Bacteroidales bacterium]
MKKTFITFLSIVALALSACQPRELMESAPSGIREIAMTLSADLPQTRTFIETAPSGWQPKWDDSDSIYVTLSGDLSKAFKFTNGSGEGITGSFSGSIEAEDGSETIYAFHPRKSNRSENIFKFVTGPDQKLPRLTTFDPEADVLVSDALQVSVSGNKAEAAGSLHFHRVLAVSKIVVADATSGGKLSGKKIRSVSLKSSAATLSGEVRVDITTAAIDGWESKSQQNYVKAMYSGDDWTADSSTGVFVILNPTTLPAGSRLTLDVETDDSNMLISRSATLSSDIEFRPNVVNTLTFNISDSDITDASQLGEPVTWDFSSSAWQTEFKKVGSNDTWKEPFNMSYDGLTIVASKGKFRTDCFQMALAGSSSDCYFKFTATGNGLLKVWATNTGSSTASGRSVSVLSGGSESSIEAGGPSNGTKAECAFNVSAGDVYIYCTGGPLRIYKLEYTPGASSGGNDDPGTPDDPDVPASSAELECTTPPQAATVDPTMLYGFARSVTGGEGATSANVLHFDNGKALQTWLLARAKSEKKGDHSPVIIWLSGTFGPSDGRDFSEGHPWFDVKEVSNLSFYGTDGFVMDRIGLFCVRASNIIIRNINFQQPKANNGADAVSMQECDGVWVDHCTFTSLNQTKDYEDGSTDITHGSKNVTVSWCHYVKTQKSCLVGHSNSQSGDVAITATFHHNWFDQSSSRHPRVRFGTAHVYNNLFDGCTTYGVGSAYGAKVLVEYNCFDGVQLPTDICTYPAKESNESNLQGSVAGYLYPTQNVYKNRPAKAKDPYPLSNVQYTSYNGSTVTPLTYSDFKPAYDYTVTAAADVPEVVKANAGYGKLGWTSAPVAVNNGGITEFNGTGDDPTDPGQDDPDDPSGSGTGDDKAHTHVFYYDSSSVAQNLTDGVQGSYFTASAKTDLSKDYSQNFNPWTIGDYSSTKGLKLNSSGALSFTTSATFNSTVRFWFIRRSSSADTAKIQIVPDGGTAQEFPVPYDTAGDSGELALEKGKGYTIKQKSAEQALLLVIVKETE